MNQSNSPWLSLIIPTRNNCEKLTRFLDSLAKSSARPEDLEVVLVVEEDDEASRQFEYAALNLVKAVCPGEQSLGSLYKAGYEASGGRYLMLLNDNLQVRTTGWDLKVLELLDGFHDQIALIHLNDLIFEESMCAFPLISRAFCQIAGEVCPPDYRHHRIGDHIYGVFNLLALLGYQRIIYLPEIKFANLNYKRDFKFKKIYQSDEAGSAEDRAFFDALLPRRKELALKLAATIRLKEMEQKRRLDQAKLDMVYDSLALNTPDYRRQVPAGALASLKAAKLTVGLIGARTQEHGVPLGGVSKINPSLDLVTYSGQCGGSKKPACWNGLLELARGDYLFIATDQPQGLPDRCLELWERLTPEVGLAFSFSEQDSGGSGSRCLQLIDRAKIGYLRFTELYKGGLALLDYALSVWEQGYRAVGDLERLAALLRQELEAGREPEQFDAGLDPVRHFVEQWLMSGRLENLSGLHPDTPEWRGWEELALGLGSAQWLAPESEAEPAGQIEKPKEPAAKGWKTLVRRLPIPRKS